LVTPIDVSIGKKVFSEVGISIRVEHVVARNGNLKRPVGNYPRIPFEKLRNVAPRCCVGCRLINHTTNRKRMGSPVFKMWSVSLQQESASVLRDIRISGLNLSGNATSS